MNVIDSNMIEHDVVRKPVPTFRHHALAGFTLIETLVAFAIVAIALGTLLGGISAGLRADRSADGRRRALRVAQARLERLGIAEPLAEGLSEGITDEGQAWRQTVTPVQVPADRGDSVPGSARVAAYWAEVSVVLREGGEMSLAAVKLVPLQPRPRT